MKTTGKILILSCSTGEGHNTCAKALKSAFEAEGFVCDLQDALSLASEGYSKIISQSYDFLAKNDLVGAPYEIAEWYSELKHKPLSPVYQVNKIYTRKLFRLIKDNGYSAVVCTHLFPAFAMTFLMGKAALDISTFFVATDYLCYPLICETQLDGYMIAHNDLVEDYLQGGVPAEKIHPTGIPCNESAFLHRTPMEDARSKLSELFGWHTDSYSGRWFLIMGGSMGFGNVDQLITELFNECSRGDRIICVCGRNYRQKIHIDEQYGSSDIIKTIAFTGQVSLLMDACDVLFTKPGGLTSTEALIKNIPLIHTAPIRGVEDKNAHFFSKRDMSFCSSDPKRQAEYAMVLCGNSAAREAMLQAQRLNRNVDACHDVIDIIKASFQ